MRLDTWSAPAGDGPIPNNASFPVLVYHDVEHARAGADADPVGGEGVSLWRG